MRKEKRSRYNTRMGNPLNTKRPLDDKQAKSGLDEVHETSATDASSFPLDRYNPSSRSPSPQYQRPSETPSPRSPNVGSYDYPGDWECYEFNPAIGRTLKIEYWDRTRECKERKWDHMDYIDENFPSREQWIYESVLNEENIVLEPNMFPYNTPSGIEHWTLWSKTDLTLQELEDFVMEWIQANKPEVVKWNYDENYGERSIDIYHKHVYFQTVPDEVVGRKRVKRDEREEMEEYLDEQGTDEPVSKRAKF